MLSTNLFLLSLVASINAIPVPKAQTPDFKTLDTCPNNGAIVCSPDGSSFYLCNFGRAVPMGSVAAGTTCKNGKIYTIGASVAPTPDPEPTAMPSYLPEPTTAELVMTTTPESKPTPAPVTPKPVTPEPEPSKDEITSTIVTTENVTTISTSTILVTMTGQPPDMPTKAPAPVPTPNPPTSGKITITEGIILKIGPNAKSCPRQGEDRAPEECATAEHAAPFITEAFAKYKIETVGEAAAILSLMMYETADFQYNKNHFGGNGTGNPGQGTRNMMSPNFIVQYAQTFGSTDSIQGGLTPENIGTATDEVKNRVLELVLDDDKTWATGAWFYATHTPCAAIMSDLQKTPVSTKAWENYITKCVGTTVDKGRRDGFTNAVAAFGGELADEASV